MLGNPTQQLGHFTPAKMPTKRVKVVADGWYGVGGKPVKLGQVLTLDADLVRGLLQMRRVELVQ